jgi:hypothetical protein
MHRAYPDTIYVPPPEELAALKAGDFVKLAFHTGMSNPEYEIMWVEVTGPGTGVLSNDPTFVPLKHLDPVKFEPRHVRIVMTPEEMDAFVKMPKPKGTMTERQILELLRKDNPGLNQ